jgi:WD40 repeat protein
LNEKDRRPKPTPILHPWFREDRFFDSLGPGGVRTPRTEYVNDHPTHAEGGQDLEIDKSHIRQYAHYGYVYCMLLAKGLREDPKEEVLISGGGDGGIKLWTLGGKEGSISELHKLDDGREEGESVLSLALDGTFLYAGRINGEVNVWDLETRQLVRNLKTKTEDVLALSLGGGYLFCAGVSGVVDVSLQTPEARSVLISSRNSTTNSSYFRDSKPITDAYWRPLSPSSDIKTYTSLGAMTILSLFGISTIVCKGTRQALKPVMVCSGKAGLISTH